MALQIQTFCHSLVPLGMERERRVGWGLRELGWEGRLRAIHSLQFHNVGGGGLGSEGGRGARCEES